jgi:mRNA interferase MazF
MVEQVKSIDFRARRVRFVEKVPTLTLHEVLSVLDACIY